MIIIKYSFHNKIIIIIVPMSERRPSHTRFDTTNIDADTPYTITFIISNRKEGITS